MFYRYEIAVKFIVGEDEQVLATPTPSSTTRNGDDAGAGNSAPGPTVATDASDPGGDEDSDFGSVSPFLGGGVVLM